MILSSCSNLTLTPIGSSGELTMYVTNSPTGTQMNVTVSSMKAKVESDTKFLDMPSKAGKLP